jgi:hypothetical protein
MVTEVRDCKLFHLTETKPYKQAFALDQQVTIGEVFNPFFGFYESAREYPVLHEGQTIQVKAVDWLKRVRDGQIRTDQQTLAKIAAEVAVHYVMLCREIIMEEMRREEFDSSPPSRQRCLFVCDTLDEARNWKGFVGQASIVCELTCTGTTHRADQNWLLGDSEPLSVSIDRARRYWRGEASANPKWETLFVGQAKVTGFGL